jgi:hypothetical protein
LHQFLQHSFVLQLNFDCLGEHFAHLPHFLILVAKLGLKLILELHLLLELRKVAFSLHLKLQTFKFGLLLFLLFQIKLTHQFSQGLPLFSVSKPLLVQLRLHFEEVAVG